jgi:hypothetical protein
VYLQMALDYLIQWQDMDIEPLTDLCLFIIVDHNNCSPGCIPANWCTFVDIWQKGTIYQYKFMQNMHFFLLLIIVKLLNIQCTYFSSFTLECRALQALQLGEKQCANVNLSPAIDSCLSKSSCDLIFFMLSLMSFSHHFVWIP